MPSRHRKETEVNLYTYSILELECGVWSVPCPGRFNQVDSPGPHCIGGWVGLGAGKILPPPGFETRTVQPVASRLRNLRTFTHYTVQKPKILLSLPNFFLITDSRLEMDFRSTERLDGLQYDVLCTFCREGARPLIALCEQGHYVCSRCSVPPLESCPACDQNPLVWPSSAVESVARPTVRDVSLAAECGCPVSVSTGLQCHWTGKLDEIKKHIIQNHDRKISDKSGKFSMPFTDVTPQASYSLVISTLGEVFMRRAQIRDENFYLVVMYIGPQKNASKYKYSFTISRKNSVENISICQKTRSFLENCDDIYRSRNCVKLHYDVVSDFLLDSNELPNVMEISKV